MVFCQRLAGMTLYPKDGDGVGGDPSSPDALKLPPGAVLAGRYRVERRLGAGGMGAVYEVFDQHLEEAVALKLLHPDLSRDDEHRRRLRAEVRLARRVSHPNVCRVHDLGEHEAQLFVTMELIRGDTLRRSLHEQEHGPGMTLPRRIDVVVQVCSALSAAHGAGVLHRDVKPDNIILEHGRAVLTDFGVAGLVTDLAAQRRVIAGTPAYIAPEVLRGQRFDQRIDVFATAVVAYELLAGRQPFPTANLDAAVQRARTSPPVPPLPAGIADAEVVSMLHAALARALAFAPAERTRSVDALASELAEAARGHGGAVWSPPAGAVAADSDTLAGIATPTVTAASVSVGGAPIATRHPTTGRAQVRVATVLEMVCQGERDLEMHAQVNDAELTRPIVLAGPGDLFERIVVDLGGTPLAVSATGITALFGAPVTVGDDAARAARAAHALLSASVAGRVGLDTGRLLYRRDPAGPSASGEALNRAAALADEASPGQVRATPPTARQLAGRFELVELGGHGERALEVRLATADGIAIARAVEPLLGRDAELAALEQLILDSCETRQPRFAAVVAPAGYGKSRLRASLVERIDERREVDWLLGRATPLGEVAPLSLLGSAAPGWVEAAGSASAPDRRAMFTAARRWLEERATRRPVVLLLEDVQWADEVSLALVNILARELDRVPVAVILFGRPERRAAAVGADGERTVIELGPIADDAALRLARRLAPAAADNDLEVLVGRAGGNPFFVEELARELAERGQAPTRITPLPATVEAAVQGRLDRLPLRAREVACAAAVVGREFWREAARAALPAPAEMDDALLDAILAELEHRAIVSPLPPTEVDDERYVFGNALVRDVAYQQLAPRERRRAHTAVARWLEPRVRDPERADPALLAAVALHYDLGGDPDNARRAYLAAGIRALALFAYREAAQALRRARELTDEPPAALLELLGDAVSLAETTEAGEAAYLAALDRIGDRDPLVAGRLLDKLASCATRRADNTAALEYARRGMAILAPDDELTDAARRNPTVLASLYGGLGWLLGYVMTDNASGLAYSERAVALLERTPHRRELARALSRLGANYMRAGRWSDQLECNQRNLSIGRELGDLFMQMTAHINLGVTYSSMGRFDEAIDHTRRALELARRTSTVTTMALVRSNLGGWLLDRGELDAAAIELDRAVDLGERVGYRRFLPECCGFRARLAVARGDLNAAETAARRALALATGPDPTIEPTIDEGIAARILAGVLALAGQYDEAEPLLVRARTCLSGSDPFEAARTTAQTARLLALRARPGDRERATSLREEARSVFQRMGAARDLALLDDDREVR